MEIPDILPLHEHLPVWVRIRTNIPDGHAVFRLELKATDDNGTTVAISSMITVPLSLHLSNRVADVIVRVQQLENSPAWTDIWSLSAP